MVTIKGDAVANKGGCSVGEGARPNPMKPPPSPKHSLAMDEVGEQGNEEEEEEKEGREEEEE